MSIIPSNSTITTVTIFFLCAIVVVRNCFQAQAHGALKTIITVWDVIMKGVGLNIELYRYYPSPLATLARTGQAICLNQSTPSNFHPNLAQFYVMNGVLDGGITRESLLLDTALNTST